MPYRFLEHTADIAAEITADDLALLFADALRALSDTVTEIGGLEERLERTFELSAPDAGLLLVDWLSEAVYAFEVEGLLFRRATVELRTGASGVGLRARAWGERFDPDRHPLKVPIKGVTYHGSPPTCRDGRWTARVVFDI